jgi:hypothetical protein
MGRVWFSGLGLTVDGATKCPSVAKDCAGCGSGRGDPLLDAGFGGVIPENF